MKALLLDLDGVVYVASEPIPGAAAAIGELQAAGVPHRFLTNTSTRSRADLVEKLGGIGIDTDVSTIINPPFVAARWLGDRDAARIALFATESARAEFEGLPLLPDDAEEGADYVVVGDLLDDWNAATINRAFRLLHSNPRAMLLALGMTTYWQAEDGLRLDVAPYIRLLEYAADRRATVLGKPARAFFQRALDELALPPSQVAMVGDNVRTDIGGAQRLGIRGILVRTGSYRPGDLQRGVIPDAVIDSIAELPAWFASYG